MKIRKASPNQWIPVFLFLSLLCSNQTAAQVLDRRNLVANAAVQVVTHSNTPTTKLGLCEGDCDHNGHCQEGLYCYQRNHFEPVPGCSNGEMDASRTDYCAPIILSQEPSEVPTSSPITQEPSGVPTNSPIQPEPSERPTTSYKPSATPTNSPVTSAPSDSPEEPPNISSGFQSENARLVSYGGNPPAAKIPLGQCEGDCDNDSQCRGTLVCLQRGPYDPVPGCIGVDSSRTDYCIDPNDVSSGTSGGAATTDYIPGQLTVQKLGLLLSQGLDARLVAVSGQLVDYMGGGMSTVPFHGRPDAGACFADTRAGNPGGWIYVTNSEMHQARAGGVGAITFDAQGNTLEYKRVLEHTTMNCGGGRTPWETWVSCEERGGRRGHAYQVDPTGSKPAEQIVLGNEGGQWESFAYDDRDRSAPRFFMTEDHPRGALARYTPSNPDWNNTWSMLLDPNGTKDYLVLSFDTSNSGTFYWTPNREEAMTSAQTHYPLSEGIDRRGSELFFVCKSIRMIYTLQLDDGTWRRSSTVSGLFDGHPDQIKRILQFPKDLLYFTEEGGRDAGVHARDENGRFYTIMESPENPGETTGLSFSPDGKFMYIAYQDVGKLYSIWRRDGKAFGAEQVDIKYHDSETTS